jgi:hypothetical protein
MNQQNMLNNVKIKLHKRKIVHVTQLINITIRRISHLFVMKINTLNNGRKAINFPPCTSKLAHLLPPTSVE